MICLNLYEAIAVYTDENGKKTEKSVLIQQKHHAKAMQRAVELLVKPEFKEWTPEKCGKECIKGGSIIKSSLPDEIKIRKAEVVK